MYVNTKDRQILCNNLVLRENKEVTDRLEEWIAEQEKEGTQIRMNKKPSKKKQAPSDGSQNADEDDEEEESQEESVEAEQNESKQTSEIRTEVDLSENEPVSRRKKKVNDIGMDDDNKLNLPNAGKKELLVPKSEPKQELDNYQTILKQNISINKHQGKDGLGKGGARGGTGRGAEPERTITEADMKAIKEKIEQYNKDQEELERLKEDKESKGWDLKFQNYWGYIIAADRNFEQSLNMCEKLFKHVGQFREHATAYVKKVVDNMHDPNRTQ